MVAAQDRYEQAQRAVTDGAGSTDYPRLVQKMEAAFERFEQRRIEYASTPQGREDLQNRLHLALAGRHAPTGWKSPDGQPLDNPVDLETALIAGKLMRKRAERRRQRFLAMKRQGVSRHSAESPATAVLAAVPGGR